MRAFVVGNGPSLLPSDLDKLGGDVSFAVNRISKIYPLTAWRPSHYIIAEQAYNPPTEQWADDLIYHLEKPDITVWCNVWHLKWLERDRKYTPQNKDKLHTLTSCAHYNAHFDAEDCPHLWHLPRYCTFGSTLNVALQIAVVLGYDPIYLIGCDLGYKDGAVNHFTESYTAGFENVLRPARYANVDTMAAHMIAARSSAAKIYNATRGGHLEVYPRVDLDAVLHE